MIIPFRPQDNSTVALAIGASSSRIQFAPSGTSGNMTLTVYNSGSSDCFVRVGGSDVTVTAPVAGGAAGGIAIAPNSVQSFTVTGTHIAVIGTSGTLYATPGEGL